MTIECGNCAFYVPNAGRAAFTHSAGDRPSPHGQCRRYPPQVVIDPSTYRTKAFFPLVMPMHYCGEHSTLVEGDDEPG